MKDIGIRLSIKNSDKMLYIGLGLFSSKGDLESFMERNSLSVDKPFYDEKNAQTYCKRALDCGLVANIERYVPKSSRAESFSAN